MRKLRLSQHHRVAERRLEPRLPGSRACACFRPLPFRRSFVIAFSPMNSELTQSVQGSQNLHCSAAAKQATARPLGAGSSGGHAEGSLGPRGQEEERAWGRGRTVPTAVSLPQQGGERASPAVFASIAVCFPPHVCLSVCPSLRLASL